MLVGQRIADADGGVLAGDVQLHHLVLTQTDAAAPQQGGQALGLGGEGVCVVAVGDGDGAARLQQQLHGLVAQAAAQQQIVIGALLAALVQYVGTVAVHHDADGVHGAYRLRHNGGGEDHRRDGDHGDGADGGMIAHDVVHLPQGRGTQGVTAAGHQPSAAEGAPVGPDVGSDGVPGPGKAVAHCAHGADQGPSHDVGHIVDCLAHRGRRDAVPRLFRLQALRLCDDCLFHSTSQYSRPGRCSNRADNKN